MSGKYISQVGEIIQVYLLGGGINHEGVRVNHAYLPAYPNNLSKQVG